MSGPHTESPRPELEQHLPFTPSDDHQDRYDVPTSYRPESAGEYLPHAPQHDALPDTLQWSAPLSSRPLIEHPVAAFLSELADAIADGGPEPYALTWRRHDRVSMQLETGEQPRAVLAWWAGRLGATSVRVVHNWSASGDKYSVEEQLGTTKLEAWLPIPRGAQSGESTSFIPVDQLDRGFDDPPPMPPLYGDPTTVPGHSMYVEPGGDQEEPDIAHPCTCPRDPDDDDDPGDPLSTCPVHGWSVPCQPIGCDNADERPHWGDRFKSASRVAAERVPVDGPEGAGVD